MQSAQSETIKSDVAPRAPLEIWLFNKRKTATEFAKELGLSQSSLCKALLPPTSEHFQEASIRMRRVVRRATEGAVDLPDWPEPIETRADCGGSAQPSPDGATPSTPGAGAALPSGAFSHT